MPITEEFDTRLNISEAVSEPKVNAADIPPDVQSFHNRSWTVCRLSKGKGSDLSNPDAKSRMRF